MTERTFRVHPGVLEDLSDALDYYGEQHHTLPSRLVDAYVEALKRIEKYPLIGREYASGHRRVVVIPFPHLLAYVVDDDSILVAAMLHGSRDPVANLRRLQSRSGKGSP